jgi:hypothetical protein
MGRADCELIFRAMHLEMHHQANIEIGEYNVGWLVISKIFVY